VQVVSWIAIGVGVAALAVTVVPRVFLAEQVPWTSWVVPLLVMITPVGMLLLQKGHSRAGRGLILSAIPIAIVVLGFEVARLLRR